MQILYFIEQEKKYYYRGNYVNRVIRLDEKL